jgi:hypothetical protein
MEAQQSFRADLMVPLIERDQSYVWVLGDPRQFEGLLYPRLKEAVKRANEMFDDEKELERRKGLQKNAKRMEDERVLAELKKRFKMD